MNILWNKDTSKGQKALILLSLLLILGSSYSLFFYRSYVPLEQVFVATNYISAIVAAAIYISFVYLYRTGKLGFKLKWSTAHKWLFAPLVLWLFLWVIISFSIPIGYTNVFGVVHINEGMAIKVRSHIRGCNHQLKPAALKNKKESAFKYCISKDQYIQLPENEFEAELTTRKSSLGYIVENIKIL